MDVMQSSETDPRSSASRKTLAWALGAALVPFLLLVWRFDFVCDDAYITFRYARNFAAGEGLVYNLGAQPPVEGYSEFLWALWLGLGFKLGVAPESWSRLASVASGVALILVLVRALHQRFAPSPAALLGAALFLGCLPPLGVWATSGLATMPFTLAVTLVFLLTWRAPRPATGLMIGLAAAAAALLRADGALWVAAVLGPAILVGLVRRNAVLWRAALGGAVLSAGAFGIHVAWRVSMYGDWLPNTARAKLGFGARATERGLDYAAHFALTMPGIALAAALALVLLAPRRAFGKERSAVAAALLVVLGTTIYAVVVGGDFMTFGRFFVPAMPFVVLSFGAVLEALGRVHAVAPPLVALSIIGLTLPPVWDRHPVPERLRAAHAFRHNQRNLFPSERQQWKNMAARADEWSIAGRGLAKYAPEGSSLVFGAVGAIGYFSDLFIYDRNGLVTREVAMRPVDESRQRSPGHDKTVRENFFNDLKPTYVDAGIWPEALLPPRGKALTQIEVLGPAERPGHVVWVQPGPR